MGPLPHAGTIAYHGRPPMTPRLIMFDFDGTLADSFGCFLDVADAVADRYGFARLDRNDMAAVRALGARQIIQRQGVPLWKVPMIARHARTLMARDIDRVPLFAGIGTALAELAAGGARLAIVTSNSRDNVLRVLGPATAALVGELECGASLFGKAGRLRRVLRRSRVPQSAALFVGDEIRDAEAARAAGVPFGAVAWGYTSTAALRAQAPAHFFERVEDLSRLSNGR